MTGQISPLFPPPVSGLYALSSWKLLSPSQTRTASDPTFIQPCSSPYGICLYYSLFACSALPPAHPPPDPAWVTSNHPTLPGNGPFTQMLPSRRRPGLTQTPHEEEPSPGQRKVRGLVAKQIPLCQGLHSRRTAPSEENGNGIYKFNLSNLLFILCKVFLVLINASFPLYHLISASISFLEACDYSNSAFG